GSGGCPPVPVVQARCVDVAEEWTGGDDGEVRAEGGPSWGVTADLASGPGWACALTGIGGYFDSYGYPAAGYERVEITYESRTMQWKLYAGPGKIAWARCVK
ncbi:MAG TPA: hypothetical protein VIV11_15375, partial [Kofleriaceae bacterium]